MNPLFAAAADIQRFCSERGWKSTVIGGLAVQRWGEPRQSRDVDLALLSGLGGEAGFVDPLLDAYRPRMTEARQFALERRVVLVETIEGVPLDIIGKASASTALASSTSCSRCSDSTTTTSPLQELFMKHPNQI